MRRVFALTAFLASAALMIAAAVPADADPGGNGKGNGNPPAHAGNNGNGSGNGGGSGNGNGAGNTGSPSGANGTVKVHDWPDHKNASDNANDPKVCRFELHGTNFDAGQSGIWWIQAHKWGNGDRTKAVLEGSYAADGNGDWTRGDFGLEDGHYKLFVEIQHSAGNSGNTVTTYKMKVFKVECPAAAPTTEQGGQGQQGQQGQEQQQAVAGQQQAPMVGVAPIVEAPAAQAPAAVAPAQAGAQVAGQQAAPVTALPSTSTASTPLVLSAFLAGLGAWILRRR